MRLNDEVIRLGATIEAHRWPAVNNWDDWTYAGMPITPYSAIIYRKGSIITYVYQKKMNYSSTAIFDSNYVWDWWPAPEVNFNIVFVYGVATKLSDGTWSRQEKEFDLGPSPTGYSQLNHYLLPGIRSKFKLVFVATPVETESDVIYAETNECT